MPSPIPPVSNKSLAAGVRDLQPESYYDVWMGQIRICLLVSLCVPTLVPCTTPSPTALVHVPTLLAALPSAAKGLHDVEFFRSPGCLGPTAGFSWSLPGEASLSLGLRVGARVRGFLFVVSFSVEGDLCGRGREVVWPRDGLRPLALGRLGGAVVGGSAEDLPWGEKGVSHFYWEKLDSVKLIRWGSITCYHPLALIAW